MVRNQKGFTLIELLIVVVIIGILAAIAIPKFSATREKAYYSAMRSDLRNLATQQELYYTDHDYEYASDVTDPDLGFTASSGVTVTVTATDPATGWAAEAEHAALDTEGCAVFHGTGSTASTPGGRTPGNAGVIVCDDGSGS